MRRAIHRISLVFDQVRQAPLLLVLLLSMAVLLVDCGAMELSRETGRIAAIWLANGILVTVLLRLPVRSWWYLLVPVFLANVAANMLCGDAWTTATALSLANAVETLIVAWPLRFFKLDRDIRSVRSVVVFLFLALGPATAASSLIAAFTLSLVQSADFATTAFHWYCADAVGLVLMVPIGTHMRLREFQAVFKPGRRLLTLACLAVIPALLGLTVVIPGLPIALIIVPVILVLSFLRGYAGAVLGMTVTGIVMMAGLKLHAPTLADRFLSLRDLIVYLQLFLILLNITALSVSAQLRKREVLERQLRSAMRRALAAHDEAQAARQAADFANRAKSQFLANMSHELRTPLNAILGFADIMRNDAMPKVFEAKRAEYAGSIYQAGSHLLNLVNDILDISKIEAGRRELDLECLDLHEPLREAVELIQELSTEKNITLAVELPERAIAWTADRRAVKQIALNLLSNAVKFTPQGGEVRLSLEYRPADLKLTVCDNGIGIPAAAIPRLGNPFEQVRPGVARSHQGTGLGLALVKALARLHGGTVTIDSTEHIGTTVSVFLPASEDGEAAADDIQATAGSELAVSLAS